MILESEDERNAWEFVKKLAHDATDRICNDLEKEDYEKFKHLEVKTCDDDLKKEVPKEVCFDFDVINWLDSQVKGSEEKQ